MAMSLRDQHGARQRRPEQAMRGRHRRHAKAVRSEKEIIAKMESNKYQKR